MSRENLGVDAVARGGRVAPRRLRAHRGGVGLGRRRRHHLGVSTSSRATASRCASASSCSMTVGEPPRREGVGPPLRRAHLHLRRRARWPDPRSGSARSYFGNLGPLPVNQEALDRDHAERRAAHGHRRSFAPAAGVLVGRGRALRRRGDLERRARVPEARVEERGDDAHVDGDRSSARTFFGLSVLAHRLQPDRARRTRRCCRSWARPCSARARSCTTSCSSRRSRS